MLPLAMNELIQKNLKDVGIDVDLQPVEWNTLLTRWRAGFKTPDNEGLNAWNISWNFLEPWSGFGRFFHSKAVVPVAVNTMPYINPRRTSSSTRQSGPSTPTNRTRSSRGCTRLSWTTPRGSSSSTTRIRAPSPRR
jgi:ABC-type dipeptide transport system, periplasmic component